MYQPIDTKSQTFRRKVGNLLVQLSLFRGSHDYRYFVDRLNIELGIKSEEFLLLALDGGDTVLGYMVATGDRFIRFTYMPPSNSNAGRPTFRNVEVSSDPETLKDFQVQVALYCLSTGAKWFADLFHSFEAQKEWIFASNRVISEEFYSWLDALIESTPAPAPGVYPKPLEGGAEY